MPDSNDLIKRIAAATGATIGPRAQDYGHGEYESSYSGSSPARAIAGTIGSASGDFILRVIEVNKPLLVLAGLVGLGSLGAAFMAQSVARAVGSPQGLMVAYVALVSISGVVAAVAINAVGEPMGFVEVPEEF